MTAENMVLRTVYVDSDVDKKLRDEALQKHTSKANLFRDYLGAGINAVKQHPDLLESADVNGQLPLVLRTIHLDPRVDNKLRVEAFTKRTSKNDMMRRYLRIGMDVLVNASRQGRFVGR